MKTLEHDLIIENEEEQLNIPLRPTCESGCEDEYECRIQCGCEYYE